MRRLQMVLLALMLGCATEVRRSECECKIHNEAGAEACSIHHEEETAERTFFERMVEGLLKVVFSVAGVI